MDWPSGLKLPSWAIRDSYKWWIAPVLLVAFGLMPKDSFWLNVGVLSLITATAAFAWNLLAGYTGQFSFGPAIFFGIGAYAVAVSQGALDLTAWAGIAIGIVVSALIAGTIGYPVFRLRGHHFIIATIALQLIAFVLISNTSQLGGATGLPVPITGTSLSSLQFSPEDRSGYYWVALAAFVGTALLLAWILHTPAGFYSRAIRDDEEAAKALGVQTTKWKLVMFCTSSAVTSVAGSLYATYALFVDPNVVVVLKQSVLIALPAVLGGLGTFWGPLLGSFALEGLSSGTRTSFSGAGLALDLILYGFLIMLVTAYYPRGIIGAVDQIRRRLKPRRQER